MWLNLLLSKKLIVCKLVTDARFVPPANEVCEGYVFTGACLSTAGGGGHAWQERRPLQRVVRFLLECILVWEVNS